MDSNPPTAIKSEQICFCSKIELRSDVVDLYDRSAQAYNMVLLVLAGGALIGLYFLRILPSALLMGGGLVLIFLAPVYYVYSIIFWSRPYEKIQKRTGLPIVDPEDATYFVIGSEDRWQLPKEVATTPFEPRHYPALASYFLSPNVSMDHICYLLPIITLVNAYQNRNLYMMGLGVIVFIGVMYYFPWNVWYDVAPGRINFMREGRFGRSAQLELRYLLEGKTVIADLAKRRLILLGADKTDVINLRQLKDADEFCYYAMLARATTPLATDLNEPERRPNAQTIGGRL